MSLNLNTKGAMARWTYRCKWSLLSLPGYVFFTVLCILKCWFHCPVSSWFLPTQFCEPSLRTLRTVWVKMDMFGAVLALIPVFTMATVSLQITHTGVPLSLLILRDNSGEPWSIQLHPEKSILKVVLVVLQSRHHDVVISASFSSIYCN